MATHSSILALEKPMDRGAWWASGHGVAKRLTKTAKLELGPHQSLWLIVAFPYEVTSIKHSSSLSNGCKWI